MAASGRAGAQPAPRDLVVVEVSPPGALDAYRLRGAIGVELGVDAVGPDDPRAATSRGSLRVVVDAESHHLTVSYKKKTEPETRTVDLPADAEAAQKAAVVLAGNLGRDEASELAAQLRKAPSAAPKETPPPRPTAPPEDAGATEKDDADRNGRDMQAALDYYAAQDRSLRKAIGWTMLGGTALAAGAVAAAPFVNHSTSANSLDYWSGAGLIALALTGMSALSLIPILTPTPIERLADYDRQGAGPQLTADAWAKAAAHEHSARRVAGVLDCIGGGVELVLGLGAALYPSTPAGSNAAFSAIMLVAGGFNTIMGVVALANDGPTETALHAYERSHGIPPWKLAEHVAVAPTPGGAVGSFAFRF